MELYSGWPHLPLLGPVLLLGPKFCPRGFNNISWDIWVLLSVFYKPAIKIHSMKRCTGPLALFQGACHSVVGIDASYTQRPRRLRFSGQNKEDLRSHIKGLAETKIWIYRWIAEKVSLFSLSLWLLRSMVFCKSGTGVSDTNEGFGNYKIKSKSESSFNTEFKRNLQRRGFFHIILIIELSIQAKKGTL